jgi:hypothetical protein
MNASVSKKAQFGFAITLAIICLLGAYIQQQLFISWDVSALLHATEKLLEGGNYIDDFFIPNPPMILYLYVPPVVVAKLLHVSITVVFPVYIFLLAVCSFVVCYKLINQIFLKQDWPQRYIFAALLASIFLIIPIYEFGQRDYLLVVMAMPYLLAMGCRLEAKPVSCSLAIAIGVLAGFGVAIKPQFLLLPLLLESYYLYCQRSWLSWARPEVFGIIAVHVFYLIVLLITRQDYITVMAPYLAKHYYRTSLISWFTFLFNDSLLFIYAALVFHHFLNKMNPYRKLSNILCVTVLSYILIYLLQGFVYFYHIVPALSLAILMLAQLYANVALQEHYNYKALAIPAACMLLLIAYLFDLSLSMVFFDPAVYFVLFSVFFVGFYFTCRYRNNAVAVLSIAALLALIYALFQVINSQVAYFMQNLVTLCMLLLFLKVFLSNKSSASLQRMFTAVLGAALFMTPGVIELSVYHTGLQYKRYTLNKLIDFIHTLPPHQSIYVFSTGIHYTFPLASYTDVDVVQRFDALWMVRGFVKQIIKENREVVQDNIKNNTSKMFIVNIIVDDLRKRKPDLIFVETNYQGQRTIGFNYLQYFLKNDAFQVVWKNYHYLATVEQPGTFKLDVYQRTPAT